LAGRKRLSKFETSSSVGLTRGFSIAFSKIPADRVCPISGDEHYATGWRVNAGNWWHTVVVRERARFSVERRTGFAPQAWQMSWL
jgi:hypothetical protein